MPGIGSLIREIDVQIFEEFEKENIILISKSKARKVFEVSSRDTTYLSHPSLVMYLSESRSMFFVAISHRMLL